MEKMEKIALPARELVGRISINYALQKRTSCRNYEKKPLTLKQVSNVLWSAQGIVSQKFDHRRTAPSAGATFPLEIYAAIRKNGVDGLEQGIYHYLPVEHTVERVGDKDVTDEIVKGSYSQEFIRRAGVLLLIAADYDRTTQRYASRGERYVYMEAGAVTQNIGLEVVEHNLGTVIIGAFDDNAIKGIFSLEKLAPLAIMPVGHPKDKSIYA